MFLKTLHTRKHGKHEKSLVREAAPNKRKEKRSQQKETSHDVTEKLRSDNQGYRLEYILLEVKMGKN